MMNAVLAAAGSNLRKLLGLIRRAAGRFVFAPGESLDKVARAIIQWTIALIGSHRFHRPNNLAAA